MLGTSQERIDIGEGIHILTEEIGTYFLFGSFISLLYIHCFT